MKQFGLPLVGAAVALALSACGGSSGGNNTVSLSGKVSGYTIVSNSIWHKVWDLFGPTPAYAAMDQVDTLVAIPHHSGNIDEGVFDDIKTAAISDDGSFSLDITKDYDWVLLLVNSNATAAADKIVAYVTIPATTDTGATDDSSTLVDFPATQASSKSISLGTVSRGTQLEYAVADQDTDDITQHMNLTLDDLNEMAKYDDAYQNLSNAYLNYTASSGVFYYPTPTPTWEGPLAYTLNDAFSNPADLFYQGNQFTLTTNDSALSFDDICNGPSVSMGLYAPESITVNVGDAVYDAAQGMVNSNMTRNGNYCYNDLMNIEQNSNGFQMAFPTGSGGFKTSVTGLWELRQDGEILASFDFDKAKPVYSPLNIPVDFIPLVRVNIAPNDPYRIASIDIKWQRYNENTASYEDVADNASTDKLVYSSFINLVDYSDYGAGAEEPTFIQYDNNGLLSGTITIDGGYTWYNPDTIFTADPSNGTAKVTDLSVAYTMAGINYRFGWSN